MEPDPPAESPNPVPETAPPVRSWVWHATLESRKAGQVSVLACAETIFAVVLYWWIAIRYDTHWHLVSSVFVAPLLLLRSTESIEAGVRWFQHDWFGLTKYDVWPTRRKADWILRICVPSGLVAYVVSSWLSHHWLVGLHGWSLGVGALTVSYLSIAIATAVVVAGAGISEAAGAGMAVFAGMVAGAVGVGVGVGVAAGVAGAGAVIVGAWIGTWIEKINLNTLIRLLAISLFVVPLILPFIIAMGLGLAMRGLALRFVATLRFVIQGVHRNPENWRENNFLTDLFVPAELMPGIRESDPTMAFDGILQKYTSAREIAQKALIVLLIPFLFLPAFLYRLNIKATAWFWWPLAYLLNPTPKLDAESQAKQALCWPWTNPFQKGWIVVSVVLVLLSLVLHSIDRESWVAWNKVPAIPLALKVSFAIDWQQIAPWHWAQWVIAASGAIMLALAGNARSHDVNGNWEEYRRSSPHAITWMTLLQRVRALATVSLLVMALGALAMQEQFWRAYIAIPETWIRALERFYGIKV